MAGDKLPDTNIWSTYRAGEATVVSIIEQSVVYLSATVLGELYFGAFKSGRVIQNRAAVDDLKKRFSILPCDEDTALIYGEIKTALRVKGRPIPDNDIWIAATAMQHGLTLLTRDAHFNEIAGLSLITL